MLHRAFFPILAIASLAFAATPPEWSRPFPAHRIAGNIYYVGTEDLGCFLITDPSGHILLNTGLADSPAQIVASIEKLGFRPKDVRVLLTNQAHFDHVAGFAEMQRITGAKVFATPPDAKLLETGGTADPAGITQFAAVKVDRILQNGEIIRQGAIALKVHYTFGHSPGSSSYEMTIQENGKKLNFLFANMETVVMPLSNPRYPNIVQDYKTSFALQHTLHPDIWVAAHGSQYSLAAKYKAQNFVDPDGYRQAVDKYEKLFERQVKIELGQ